MGEQCSKRVYWGGRYSGHQCSLTGTVEEGGKWYCWQHSPAACKARQEKYGRQYVEGVRRRAAIEQAHDNAIWNEAIEAAAAYIQAEAAKIHREYARRVKPPESPNEAARLDSHAHHIRTLKREPTP